MDYIYNERIFEKQAILGTLSRGVLRALSFIPKTWSESASRKITGNAVSKIVRKGTANAHRPMAGFFHKTPIGTVTELTRPKFTHNPVGWAGSHIKSSIADTASNVRRYAKNPLGGLSEEWKRAGTYTHDGKIYQRSVLGAAANRAWMTAPGSAVSAYALGGTNVKGQKVGQPKRIFGSLKEGLTWGPGAPLAMTYYGARLPYDAAKMIF